MASPVADSYSAASGVTLYGGRTAAANRPAWRRAMAPNTWATIPGNTLQSINPASNPAINPNGASPAPWAGNGGQAAVVNAWCGMAYDYATDTMWLPLQGGHGDYGGNEPYKRSLRADTSNFVMLRNPSGAVGNLIVYADGQEATGVYSDGRLRPIHSYNNTTYVPGIGPFLSRISYPYPSVVDVKKSYVLNESTGEATFFANLVGSVGEAYGAAEYDSKRNCIWYIGSTNTALVKMDLTTGTCTTMVSSNNYVNGYPRLIYLPTPDLLLLVHNGGGSGYPQSTFYLWDVSQATPTLIPVTTTGTFPSSHLIGSGMGIDWDQVNNRLLLWNTRTDQTTLVSTLTPGANPRSDPWTIGVLPVSGANAVTPTAATAAGGTFGRFRYSAYLGGCLLLNATNEPTYFFATE